MSFKNISLIGVEPHEVWHGDHLWIADVCVQPRKGMETAVYDAVIATATLLRDRLVVAPPVDDAADTLTLGGHTWRRDDSGDCSRGCGRGVWTCKDVSAGHSPASLCAPCMGDLVAGKDEFPRTFAVEEAV